MSFVLPEEVVCAGGRVFGPVPSRRLGRSLGVNNITPKVCNYSCVYCQIGNTLTMETSRREFAPLEETVAAVCQRVQELRQRGERIDYITFVPDGEPTLDVNLGRAIEGIRGLGIPVAVITNSSLLRRQDVRRELALADWVSLKFDALDPKLWQRVNAPHRSLDIGLIREGARRFAADYTGTLATETMLLRGLNDGEENLVPLAGFLATLKPAVAYLSVPTRPPARPWVEPPEPRDIARAYRIFSRRLSRVEYLLGYEGNTFSSTGDVVHDLLSITAVHPMRREAVLELLQRNDSGWSAVKALLDSGALVKAEFEGHCFYLRPVNSPGS